MKREIKFRIWDNVNRKFLSSKEISFDRIAISLNGFVYNGKYDKTIDSSNYVLQQYTGLNDKNGKEIYEGDVLKIYKHHQPEEVVFEYGAIGFYLHDNNNRLDGVFEHISDYCDDFGYEVIGNIFENSELLLKPDININKCPFCDNVAGFINVHPYRPEQSINNIFVQNPNECKCLKCNQWFSPNN